VIVRFIDIGGIVIGHHCLHVLVITLGPIYYVQKYKNQSSSLRNRQRHSESTQSTL